MITLVTILGFINVFVLLYRIDYGLYLFTVLIPFTSLLPATGIPGLNMTSFIIILLFIKSYSENKNEVPVNKEVSNLTRVIFILLIWCILSIILSRLVYTHQTLPLISYFEKLYRWFIFIFLYFVYKRELTTKEKVYYALFALSIGVLAEAAYVVKALMLSGRLRTYGTIGQSNELALFFGCYLLIQVLFFLHVKKLIYKLFFLASIFLSLTGVASTLSRGGY